MQLNETRNAETAEIQGDVCREEIVSAFRAAMANHFRAHVPGSNINEATLIASDYLNHFHELIMLFEAVRSKPENFAKDLRRWRPVTYEEHFSQSGFRDKSLAIAAYRRAPLETRARFEEAVDRLHREALDLLAGVVRELDDRRAVDAKCQEAIARLQILMDDANAIANGKGADWHGPRRAPNGQADIDALFEAS